MREFSKREKNNARSYTHWAINKGIIVKQKCSVCGKDKTQAHHTDYSDPLNIVWLCSEHHAEVHSGHKFVGGQNPGICVNIDYKVVFVRTYDRWVTSHTKMEKLTLNLTHGSFVLWLCGLAVEALDRKDGDK
jgi:hypothetical protein